MYRKASLLRFTTKRSKAIFVGLLFTATTASMLSFGVYSQIRSRIYDDAPGPRGYVARNTKTEQLPEIKSKVKELQIAAVVIAKEGTDEAVLQIGILNNSHKGVVAYEFSASNGDDFANRGTDGTIEDPDNPQVVIAPFGYSTFEWALGSIYQGMPIFLSAAKFADGSESGDIETIRMMRKDLQRARETKARERRAGQ